MYQRLFFTSEEASAVQYGPRRMKLRDLMAATLRFLHSDGAKFRVLWDWSPCVSQLLTSDVMVRGWVASSAPPPETNLLESLPACVFRSFIKALNVHMSVCV